MVNRDCLWIDFALKYFNYQFNLKFHSFDSFIHLFGKKLDILYVLFGDHAYNCIRLSLSALNRRKIDSLIRNRTIIKCFSFYKNQFFRFYHYLLRYHFILQCFYSKCLIYYLHGWQKVVLLQIFYFLRKFIRRNACCWNSKTQHEYLHKVPVLLFLITDVA